ncbi:MAG: 2-amino-4-hydroxy-6-hydroxymethyldihydropteridine diphosphokinase [Candidatus Nanopelagicales bacterium]|jgi:2-amino-4-hydroxy-6-hydroxymethyldihydropteridine diphosphokinase
MIVIISIGSNLGNRKDYLQFAVDKISSLPKTLLTRVSSIYETLPQGFTDQPNFFNAILEIDTDLTPPELLTEIRQIELAANRERLVPNGPRTLDIDVISVGNQKITGPELEVPHPRAQLRQFVLLPWLEVDPTAQLVGLGSVKELSDALADQGVVRLDGLKLI